MNFWSLLSDTFYGQELQKNYVWTLVFSLPSNGHSPFTPLESSNTDVSKNWFDLTGNTTEDEWECIYFPPDKFRDVKEINSFSYLKTLSDNCNGVKSSSKLFCWWGIMDLNFQWNWSLLKDCHGYHEYYFQTKDLNIRKYLFIFYCRIITIQF